MLSVILTQNKYGVSCGAENEKFN